MKDWNWETDRTEPFAHITYEEGPPKSMTLEMAFYPDRDFSDDINNVFFGSGRVGMFAGRWALYECGYTPPLNQLNRKQMLGFVAHSKGSPFEDDCGLPAALAAALVAQTIINGTFIQPRITCLQGAPNVKLSTQP